MKVDEQILERLVRFRIVEPLEGERELLKRFAGILESAKYEAGQPIVSKGEEGREAYLLVKGTVEVFDYTIDDEPFTRAILRDADNILFGEVALVSDSRRIATVTAKTDCECWILRRGDFIRLGNENPRLGWLILQRIAALLAKHLERTNQDVLRLFEALVNEVEHGAVR